MSLPKALFVSTLAVSASLCALPFTASASCTRADVEFYLKNGFNQEQITAICAASASPETSRNVEPSRPGSSPMKTGTPPAQASKKPQDTMVSPQTNVDLTLHTAIKGHDITVNSEHIAYTLKNCIEYSEEDLFGFRKNSCLLQRFTLGLKGLEVVTTGKKLYFFGTGEIRVRGDIQREIISGLENLDTADRKLLEAELETGNETVIPIREDVPLDRIEALLVEMAR